MAGRSPPTERWIVITITISRRSLLPMRLTMLLSALSTDAPSSISRRASANSSETGGAAVSGTALGGWAVACPAFLDVGDTSLRSGDAAADARSLWAPPGRRGKHRAPEAVG